MKRMQWKALILSASVYLFTHGVYAEQSLLPSIIPLPQSLERVEGDYRLPQSFVTRTTGGAVEVADLWSDYVKELGLVTDVQSDRASANVEFTIDAKLPAASYQLSINNTGVELMAADYAGLVYGVQSLRQILFSAPRTAKSVVLPALNIDDAPRLPYRGLHLDVSRHFFDVAFIKSYIDLIALYKMNVFHWHLTDDQGWRIEVKAFPRLTEVGAWRDGTVVGHSHGAIAASDGVRYGGFYTQDDIREVVRYATERGITVIPEIDVPGHASAILAAYPELGCSGETARVQSHFGVFEDVLCPTPETFAFLDKLIEEVATLFPGPYLHIGGDEVSKRQWQDSAFCSELMQREGLTDYGELHGWFVNQVEQIVNRHGKRIIGWDEILDGDVKPSATVMSWRGMSGGLRAAELGHDVIMTPLEHVYFDFYQSESLDEPMAIHGLTRLSDTYAFNPVDDSLNPEQAARIRGGQGNVWTEYLDTPTAVERALLPRLSALAEVLWTPRASQSYPDFTTRLPAHEALLTRLGYTVADSHYKPHVTLVKNEGGQELVIESLSPQVVFTLDGSAPTAESTRYSGPISVTGEVQLRAASLLPDGQLLGDARLSVLQHLGRGQSIHFAGEFDQAWQADAASRLLDGRIATDRIFRYPEWVGFGEENIDVTVTFQQPQSVRSVAIGVDAGKHRQLHRPTALTVSGQGENGEWHTLGKLNQAQIDAAPATLRVTFTPQSVQAIRIEGENGRTFYSYEHKREERASLRVDEIIIR